MEKVKQAFSALTIELQSLLDLAEKNLAEQTRLEECDTRLRVREAKQTQRDEEHRQKLSDLEGQKEYIRKKQEEFAVKETILVKIEQKKEELRAQEEETNKKIEKNKGLLNDLETKLKEIDIIKEKKEEQDRREALFQKEVLIDRQRKEELNNREARIEKEEQRLKRIASG